MSPAVRCAALVCLALALAACADTEELRKGLNPIQDAFGWNEEKLLRSSTLAPLPYTPEPRYCYRTLAHPDCYLRPQPHAEERLIGAIGPAPY